MITWVLMAVSLGLSLTGNITLEKKLVGIFPDKQSCYTAMHDIGPKTNIKLMCQEGSKNDGYEHH